MKAKSSLFTLFALVGCSAGTLEITNSTATTPSTSTTTSSTTSTTTSTATVPEGTRLDFVADIKTSDLFVSLMVIDLIASEKADRIVYGDQLVSAPITGTTATIYAPDAPPDSLLYMDNFSLALFSGVAFDDGDNNENYTIGENIAGMTEVMLAYVEGTLPKKGGYSTLASGWNTVLVDFDGDGMKVVGSIDAIPLPMNQLPREEISGGGTNEVISDWSETGIAVFPFSADLGDLDNLGELIHDERVDTAFTFHFVGAPPDDHFQEENGLNFAGEAFVVYADIDDNDQINGGDLPLASVCYDNELVLFYYLAQANDLSHAFFIMSSPDINAGWNAFQMLSDSSGKETQVFLSDAELSNLVAHWSCSF